MVCQDRDQTEGRAVGGYRQQFFRFEQENLGACSNDTECEAVCPKGIPMHYIACMNRDFLGVKVRNPKAG